MNELEILPDPDMNNVSAVWDPKKNAFVAPDQRGQQTKKHLGYMSASELEHTEIEPTKWIVHDMIPENQIGILGAKKKCGKSWFCIQLATAVCCGGNFFKEKCEKSGVLYIDTEGGKGRIKERLRKQLGESVPYPDNLIIVDRDDLKTFRKDNNKMLRIGEGFESEITSIVQSESGKGLAIKLIIIDIREHILPVKNKFEDDYSYAYRAIIALQDLADNLGVSFLLVTHTRKAILGTDDGDPFDEIMGSTGWSGAAEFIFTFRYHKKTGEQRFYTTGRDIVEEKNLVVELKRKDNCTWQVVGGTAEIEEKRKHEKFENSKITKTIKRLVNQGGGKWGGTATDIIECSSYFKDVGQIQDDTRAIGKFINSNLEYFEMSAMSVSIRNTNKGSRYEFTDELSSWGNKEVSEGQI